MKLSIVTINRNNADIDMMCVRRKPLLYFCVGCTDLRR